MKRFFLIILLTLACVPTISGESLVDSLVMQRMYDYLRNHADQLNNFSTNVYTKHLYQVHKRNLTLWAIPSMYTIANGQREFICEEYSRFTFSDVDNYQNNKQVYCTTIPRNKRTMSVLLKYLTPNFYNVTIYDDHILSPFNEENRLYYQFRTIPLANHQIRLYFRPRPVKNTQLVRGKAIIDERTGRIEQVEMEGEFDMIRFQTITMMGEKGAQALLPKICQTTIEFKFGGNHITSQFEAIFDCPVTLPDTVNIKGDRLLMDSIRPISLTKEEQQVYENYDRRHGMIPDEEIEEKDTLEVTRAWIKEEEPAVIQSSNHNYLKRIGWDLIGENLVRSIKSHSDRGYVKLSPILDPQYVSYSRSKGLSYKLKLGAKYNFTSNSEINFNPQVGYNFKFQEFYYTAPIHLYYNKDIDAGIELVIGNNNRISNSTILEKIKEVYGNLPELDNTKLDLFDDNYIRMLHHIQPYDWLRLESGMVYHFRHSLNATAMRIFGQESKYYSLAPSISIKLQPWPKAPLFTVDYERGLKLNHRYINYERWEADASLQYHMKRTQQFNIRLGGGLYTARSDDFFMDFANFRDNNLPGGWDDDWTGNFQLLDSRLYNRSDYYLRSNFSYETPLLAAYLVPIVGRYVERERLYLSNLSIAHSSIYSEIGYGFTCRYFTVGLFSSFSNIYYQNFGCKFTFELFQRW